MKHHNQEETGIPLLPTLFMGMAIGASLVIFSKKENRRNLQKKVNDFLEMGEDRMNEGKKRLSDGVEKLQEKLEETEDNVKSKVRKHL